MGVTEKYVLIFVMVIGYQCYASSLENLSQVGDYSMHREPREPIPGKPHSKHKKGENNLDFGMVGKISESRGSRGRHRHRRATDFSSSELTAILDKHNELRGQVSPEASDMEYMVRVFFT